MQVDPETLAKAVQHIGDRLDTVEAHLKVAAEQVDRLVKLVAEIDQDLRHVRFRVDQHHPEPAHGNCPKCGRAAGRPGKCSTCGHSWTVR